MNRIIAIFATVIALGTPAVALAFPHLYFWSDPANGVVPSSSPGAGYTYSTGVAPIYGTGSTRDRGVTCAHCHIKAPGAIDASIAPSPAWQNVGGSLAYKPGQTYSITVSLLNESKGVTTPTNNLNGFALTIEKASGQGAGVFQNDAATPVTTNNCTSTRVVNTTETSLIAAGVTTYLISPTTAGGGCYTVIFMPKTNSTVWNFKWTAPAIGSGPLTIYYGVVDGDTNGKDSKNDDVKIGTIKLAEGT